LSSCEKDKESFVDYTGSLETDMEFTRKISDELKDGCTQKEEKVKELTKEVDELQLRIADLEQENAERDEEVSEASARTEEAEAALKRAETDRDSSKNRLVILQEQNSDLKKEEVDFKSTLATAQQFAEDLKEKSKVQAAEMIAEANAEITKIRDDAHEELQRLPKEIADLEKKKGEVKADLKATLESYLETIEVFYPDDEEENVDPSESVSETGAEGDDELFQKIEINDDGSIAAEDVAKLSELPGSVADIDGESFGSLLGDEEKGEEDEDVFSLKDIFSLESSEEKKKTSS